MADKSKDGRNVGETIVHNIEQQASETAQRIKKVSPDASLAISAKVQGLVQDFNAAVPTMRALGFSVSSFTIGVGLIPESDASLKGSLRALDINQIRQVIKEHADNKSLKAIWEALHAGAKFKEQLSEMGIPGVEVDLRPGLPALVSINLLT